MCKQCAGKTRLSSWPRCSWGSFEGPPDLDACPGSAWIITACSGHVWVEHGLLTPRVLLESIGGSPAVDGCPHRACQSSQIVLDEPVGGCSSPGGSSHVKCVFITHHVTHNVTSSTACLGHIMQTQRGLPSLGHSLWACKICKIS